MNVAGAREGMKLDLWADREVSEHELHAALFGIEATAEALSRHREQLSEAQLDQLARCMADEVRRLRRLIAGRGDGTATFDLAEAIVPVITCGQAAGLAVTSSVEPGIRVEGDRDSTAQVVLALLDNVRHHAPGSPVDVHATVRCDDVTLHIEDRGPGVQTSPAAAFERGARGPDSDGSGLGLFVARRLMADQGGSIDVTDRVGGGSSFVLRFRIPAVAWR
jgi:signal transduction histidine kinase